MTKVAFISGANRGGFETAKKLAEKVLMSF